MKFILQSFQNLGFLVLNDTLIDELESICKVKVKLSPR
jgi:hypothetical protein